MRKLILALLIVLVGCQKQAVHAQAPSAHADAAAHSPLQIIASFWTVTPSFTRYVVPHVSAFMVRVNWSQIETSPGKYNFAALDAATKQWTSKGKQVALIVSLASDYGANTATPAYILKATPQATCKTFPNPNPITDSPVFENAARSFISATLAHLAAHPPLYVRFGFTGGGENFPHCWPWPNGESAFMAYLTRMAQLIASQRGPVQVVANEDGGIALSWADQEAAIFADAGLGIGIEALSAADPASYAAKQPCAGDWCANFVKYPGVYHYLQSAQPRPATDPLTYIPFARGSQFGTNAIELTSIYLSYAYDPTNANYAKYGAQMRTVLEAH